MVKEEYNTVYLPEKLKQLDNLLKTGSISISEYTQIALQLKTCQLLAEIKYELTKPKPKLDIGKEGEEEATGN